jgi:hypothetical protein
MEEPSSDDHERNMKERLSRIEKAAYSMLCHIAQVTLNSLDTLRECGNNRNVPRFSRDERG